MPKQEYTIGEASRILGVSVDTIRRWDREGKIKTNRDTGNRRVVPASEIDRVRGTEGDGILSARNRFAGIVREVKVDGLLAQVEIDVNDPVRVVAIITRESLDDLDIKPGSAATAIVKSTSVMIQR